MDSYVRIEKLAKTFPGRLKKNNKIEVLKDFNLDVVKGEFVTFFGPNACGKTTLLNVVAGLIPPTDGNVFIDRKTPAQAKIGFVFQTNHASLLPWRTNIDNVALPLELKGMNRKERVSRARNFLKGLHIEIPENNYPYELSGGQQQLMCIARALISDPDVLLLDEPFNQLDFQTRLGINEEIQDIWKETGVTILFVSHDIDEALLLADRVVLLSKRPASIVEILENKLPRPRNRKILQDDRFFKLKKKAIAVFDKVLKE